MIKSLSKEIKNSLYFSPIVKALPSDVFLRIHYRVSLGKPLNLSNPVTFNEKMQWLKLYYQDPDLFSVTFLQSLQ